MIAELKSNPRAVSFGAVVGLILAGAHWRARQQGLDYRGPWLVLDHLFDLSLAAGLLLFCAGAGRAASRRYDRFFDHPLEAFVFALAAGAGVVASALLLLGLLGGFRPWPLALAFASGGFLARRGIGEAVRLAAAGAKALLREAKTLDLCFCGLALLLVLVKALLPPTDWDSLMYHLEMPRRYLQAGRIGVIPDSLHATYVLLGHMLYVPLLALGSLAGPALVSALFAAALAAAAFLFGRRFFGGLVASKSLSFLWGSPTLLVIAMTPRVDVTLALYLFLAHGLLLRVLVEEGARPLLVPAACLLGFAVGVKLSAAAYAAALVPLILLACGRGQRAAPAAKSALTFALWSAAAFLPCLVKIALTSWPIFCADPRVFGGFIVMEPWLTALYSAQHRLPPPHPIGFTWPLPRSRDPLDLFKAPERFWAVDGDPLQTLNFLCILLPLGMLYREKRALKWLVFPPLLVVIFFIYVLRHAEMRLLTPVMAPLTVAALYIAQRGLDRFAPRARNGVLALGLALALVPTAAVACRELLRNRALLGYLSGRVSAQEALFADRRYAGNDRLQREFEASVNQGLPSGSRVLMLFEARSFYLRALMMQDARNTNWLLLSHLASPDECLRSLGVTHVLVNYGAMDYFSSLSPESAVLYFRPRELKEFVKEHLTPEIEGLNGSVLYRLR